MSWKPLNPIFILVLVFLFAGDFGLHIFVDANAIECNSFWEPPGPWNTNKKHKCGRTLDGVPSSYWCDTCHRNDKKFPTAINCVGPQKLSTDGAFTCDAGMDENVMGDPNRPIFCYHFYPAGTANTYTCKKPQLYQQCDSASCKLR
ncbi:uncharacterized protein MELLADRAFT_123858 [Melampsora larici-populina 98AG31]|uniref:Secreted protein n=1 Tax=Melampsora larici-populina (strain 98AG31 / pathotype 3-4-7) TaxID=747676 RepID=F4REP3_MELLP|nr:uncharacterized protein MELLADRAFT_123858 [Melampsora larici-populina 98AG31]EGG09135.1 secreted protein [Melampsora larici-populina 98AG31]